MQAVKTKTHVMLKFHFFITASTHTTACYLHIIFHYSFVIILYFVRNQPRSLDQATICFPLQPNFILIVWLSKV